MQEKHYQPFIDGAEFYFDQISKGEIAVGTPFLAENNQPLAADYTGVISISGLFEGVVYFTAPKELLARMLIMLGEQDLGEHNLADLVGEVANTISGNARKELGEEFNISVPFVIKGAPDEITLPRKSRSLIIPLTWQNRNAMIAAMLRNPER